MQTKAVYFLLISFFVVSATFAVAQDDRLTTKTTHHVGLQANQLLNQILSFDGADAVTNPYLIRYSIRNHKNQNDFNFGLGLDFLLDEDLDDNLKNENITLNFRAGYALNRKIGKRIEAGVSFDALFDLQNIRTVAVNSFNNGNFVDSTITKTTTDITGFGFGPRFLFDYYVTPRLKIGAESSLYFTRASEKQRIEIERYTSSGINPNEIDIARTDDEEESRLLDLNLNLPVAIFVTFVF